MTPRCRLEQPLDEDRRILRYEAASSLLTLTFVMVRSTTTVTTTTGTDDRTRQQLDDGVHVAKTRLRPQRLRKRELATFRGLGAANFASMWAASGDSGHAAVVRGKQLPAHIGVHLPDLSGMGWRHRAQPVLTYKPM
jgi:hypothetical protein